MESPSSLHLQARPTVLLRHVLNLAPRAAVAPPPNLRLRAHPNVRRSRDHCPASTEVAEQSASRRSPAIPRRVHLLRCPLLARSAEAAQLPTRRPKAKPDVPRLRSPHLVSTEEVERPATLHLPARPAGHCRHVLLPLRKVAAEPPNHPRLPSPSLLDHYHRLPAPTVEEERPANYPPIIPRVHPRTGSCFRAANPARSAAARSRLHSARSAHGATKHHPRQEEAPLQRSATNRRDVPSRGLDPEAVRRPKSSPKATSI